LRWGSPTATPPFEPFVQLYRRRTPVPELVEGALTAFVNFAYAEFHSWLLIFMDFQLLQRMTEIVAQSMSF
jgi:hypothetical protein